MDESTSFDKTKRQTINPLVDEMNKSVEPLMKSAMNEIGYTIPLTVRLYNQIRFYEEYGKLKMGTSVASKKTLAEQFGVTVEQISIAFNNLTNKYKLGKWVEHTEPVFRSVVRTWMSNTRLKRGITADENYYTGIPELLQRNSTTITREYLPTDKPPLSESKIESKKGTKVPLAKAGFGRTEINEMLDYWHRVTGYPILSKLQANRYACSNLLKRYGVSGLRDLVVKAGAAQKNRYAPRISDFIQLQAKQNELSAWDKKQISDAGFYCPKHPDNFVTRGKMCGYCS